MSKGKSNYEIAKEKANKIDEEIIETIKAGKNFKVEAGAGSGKTYSLNKVIEWLQINKSEEYKSKMQKVVCITYTNAAVDVINERLKDKSFIMASTIHTFSWNAISQYQQFLIEIIKNDETYLPFKENDIQVLSKIKNVKYTLGSRYIDNNIFYLHHNDVIKLFIKLLDNKKFRYIFSKKYPLILIDEYQDSSKDLIDKFIEYFIDENVGTQFGFFGDSWQTIYQSNKACGEIKHNNIVEIKKEANFRCSPKIVDVLNKIRKDLLQISAIDDFDGEVVVISCEDYLGERRNDRNFKGDLPEEELISRIECLKQTIKENIIKDEETIKSLMITHKMLALQQGYETILDTIGDKFKEKDDIFLNFFIEIVEPIVKAFSDNNISLLFETLKRKRVPIRKKSEKIEWQNLNKSIQEARKKKAIDVLKIIVESEVIPVDNKILKKYTEYSEEPDTKYGTKTIKEYLDIEYKQFLAAISFLGVDSEFSTEHGVKGEEYDNVIFCITKGWASYQFEKYAPMILENVEEKDRLSFERNRNLFYVCCSRPVKRLFIFVSVYIDDNFKNFLKTLCGEKNYYTYNQYIAKINQV